MGIITLQLRFKILEFVCDELTLKDLKGGRWSPRERCFLMVRPCALAGKGQAERRRTDSRYWAAQTLLVAWRIYSHPVTGIYLFHPPNPSIINFTSLTHFTCISKYLNMALLFTTLNVVNAIYIDLMKNLTPSYGIYPTNKYRMENITFMWLNFFLWKR